MFDPEINHFYLVVSPTEMDSRKWHAVAYVEQPYPETDLLYMYGGFGSSKYHNDLWVMNTHVYGEKFQRNN